MRFLLQSFHLFLLPSTFGILTLYFCGFSFPLSYVIYLAFHGWISFYLFYLRRTGITFACFVLGGKGIIAGIDT